MMISWWRIGNFNNSFFGTFSYSEKEIRFFSPIGDLLFDLVNFRFSIAFEATKNKGLGFLNWWADYSNTSN